MIQVAVAGRVDKARPVAAAVARDQQIIGLTRRRNPGEGAVDVDLGGARSPHAERRAAANQVRTHGSVGRDIGLRQHAADLLYAPALCPAKKRGDIVAPQVRSRNFFYFLECLRRLDPLGSR
jgi:hypothetical protein